ncbi:MAG: hypothetical protein AAGE43_11015 [Pseudomonadota bacterium]
MELEELAEPDRPLATIDATDLTGCAAGRQSEDELYDPYPSWVDAYEM